jgi:hypothetical protein
MATKDFNTGREKGFLIVEKLLKEQQESFENQITSIKQGLFEKPESQEYLKANITNFFNIAFDDLKRLKEGDSTEDIREVESKKIGDQKTITEGKISAIRDSYDLFLAIQPEDITAPLPPKTKSWNKKKLEAAQMDLLKEIRHTVSMALETKGRAQQKQMKPNPAEPAAGNNQAEADQTQPAIDISTQFKEVSIPVPTGKTKLDLKALKKFEQKPLVDISKLKTADEKEQYQALNNVFTSFEAYKASLKQQTFTDMLPRGAGAIHSTFCRNQAYETLELIRQTLVALMKGADIKTICKGKGHDESLKGTTKAISDVLTILDAIKPEHLPINHSAGYKLTYGEQSSKDLSLRTTGRTLKHLNILAQTIAREPDPAILFNASTILTTIHTRRIMPPRNENEESSPKPSPQN